MSVKDVKLYRDGEVYVSGDPAEISKLKGQGWSTDRQTAKPVEPSATEAPAPPVQASITSKPAAPTAKPSAPTTK